MSCECGRAISLIVRYLCEVFRVEDIFDRELDTHYLCSAVYNNQ